MPRMTSITVDHLTNRFDSVAALDDLSLEIRAGEMFFVLGPRGCGKTTLWKVLAGFLKPTAGRLLFSGEDVPGLSPERRQCGMMFKTFASGRISPLRETYPSAWKNAAS